MTKSSLRFLVALLLTSAPLLYADSVQGTFDRTYSVSGPVDLEVLTRSGDISVRNGPAGSVVVHGKIHVGERWLTGSRQGDVSEVEKNPPISQNGNSIRIDYLKYHDISVDYEITAPADTSVQTQSGSGNQSAEGLAGKLNLESGSGDMRLREIGGSVHLRTGSGDVDARGLSGAFDVECGSGDVRIEGNGTGGDSRVRTGSGSIQLRGIKGGLRAESGSGDVTVSGTQTAAWDVRTSSGNVELELQPGAAFDLNATAGSGNVVVDGPVAITVDGDVGKTHHSIHGKVGGGGPLVTVRTGSGDVHIH
jgi:Putative adhesin